MSTYYIASRPVTQKDIIKINKYILDGLVKNKFPEYATINLSCELIEKTYAISYKNNYLIIFDYNNKRKSFTECGRFGGNRAEELFDVIGRFSDIEFISEYDERYQDLKRGGMLH